MFNLFKPTKYTWSFFGIFILYFLSPFFLIIFSIEFILFKLIAVPAFISWYGVLHLLRIIRLPVAKPCLEGVRGSCLAPEPTDLGIILTIILNIIIFYLAASFISAHIKYREETKGQATDSDIRMQ